MTGVYFSGTGNSKYCTERFVHEYNSEAKAFSIEDKEALNQIAVNKEIVFGYPVQYSSLPKIVKDFIDGNQKLWQGRRIFIIATMGLFSGDGAGVLARALKKHGADIIGGLHLKMPDNICDEKILKRPFSKNRTLIRNAEKKIELAVSEIKAGKPPREGLGFFSRTAGLFGQRLYFSHRTDRYSDKLKISADKCIGCGKCISLCPLKNIALKDGKAVSGTECTMCYRCVNRCPVQAITLLGKKVIEQYTTEQYL